MLIMPKQINRLRGRILNLFSVVVSTNLTKTMQKRKIRRGQSPKSIDCFFHHPFLKLKFNSVKIKYIT